jgi:hypothetical protein
VTAISKIVIGAGFGAALAACSPTTNTPLFFAQTHTFGVGIHGSPTQQSADLTLGYRDLDVAIVPVSVTDGAGQVVPLISTAGGGNSRNALSVLGQFNANAATNTPTVSLGTFFATGLAADKLADGFSDKLSKSP